MKNETNEIKEETGYMGETMDGKKHRATLMGAKLYGWSKWLPSRLGSKRGVGTIRNTGWMPMSLAKFENESAE